MKKYTIKELKTLTDEQVGFKILGGQSRQGTAGVNYLFFTVSDEAHPDIDEFYFESSEEYTEELEAEFISEFRDWLEEVSPKKTYTYTDTDGTEWIFALGKHVNGGDILIATSNNGTESDSLWTTDLLSLPKSDGEAAEYLNELDWAVGQSDEINWGE